MDKRGESTLRSPSAPGWRILEDTYAPCQRQGRHAHAHTNVSLVLAGSVEEIVGRAIERAYALSVVVKPGDTEHDDQFGTQGAKMFSVILTPEFTQSLRDWAPGLNHWGWNHGGPATRSMLRLLKTYRRNQALLNAELEDCIYETLASFPNTEIPTVTTPPRWFELIKQELDEMGCELIRVSELAAHADVHPVYLARQFRRYVGCSITEYRARLRTRAAAEMLVTSTASIASAACQSGFADQSHLCRTFKFVTGITPLDYRRLGRTRPSN